MRMLEIALNGRKVCSAGVGELGALTTIVHWKFRSAETGSAKTARDDLGLYVGGWNELAAEDVRWLNRRLQVGDEVRIRIVEGDKASRPAHRERSDPKLAEKSERKYVESAAKRLGWKIVKPRQARTR